MGKNVIIKLNDEMVLTKLLQESYMDSVKLINEATNFISTLQNSTELKDTLIEDKVKYMKAMNDLLKTKDNANRQKLAIAQVLQDQLFKTNKPVKPGEKPEEEYLPSGDEMKEMFTKMREEMGGGNNNTEHYTTK